MEKKFDVLCVGSGILDILTDGMEFETLLQTRRNSVNDIRFGGGGDAFNESIALSRLGCRVGFLSRMGDDFAARFLMDLLERDGVDVSGVRIVPGCPTAANNILIGKDDRRIFNFGRNPNNRLEFCGEDLNDELVRQAKIVSFASIFIHPKFDEAAYTRLFRTAKESGAVTSADVVYNDSGCTMAALGGAVRYLDFLFANEEEAAGLSGRSDPDAMAEYFLDLGIGTAVIKLGGRGSLIKNRQERIEQPAFYVEPVDSTGAGDCYAAGFLWGLSRGLPLADCARIASATGALAVQKLGATAGIESAEQVEAFLRHRAED